MKACSYCGRDNDDDEAHCRECGTEFPATPAAKYRVSVGELESRELAGPLSQLDLGFRFVEGFSRPAWKTISAFIKASVPEADRTAASNFVAKQWLAQLKEDLGGTSEVYQSKHFFALSDLEPEVTRSVLNYAESSLKTIRGILREAAWNAYHGKHVLLLFADIDDYFAYISYYYPEGSHALSAGVCLRKGYVHVAIPYTSPRATESVLPHELVHNLLAHRPIPTWLNEGIAVSIEARVSGSRRLVNQELMDRHVSFWTEKNIQRFWAGHSFHAPGDESELSYSLGQILVGLLAEKKDFIPFLMNADWRDAGQAAALETLDCNLGDLVAGVLGPGNWRPQRKLLKELFDGKATGEQDIADCTEAIAADPNDAQAYVKRGSAQYEKGDLGGALADFNKALEINPELARAYYGRGLVHKHHGEFDSAMRDFDKTIEFTPDYPMGYNARGNLRKVIGDFAGALEDYDHAIAVHPESVVAYYGRGCLHQDARNFAVALNDFRQVLVLEPRRDHARFRVWMVRARLGEVEAATRELQNFLAVRSKTDWVSKIGQFLVGQLSEAEFLHAATSPGPATQAEHKAQAYYYAGEKLLIAGDTRAAADRFREALAGDFKTQAWAVSAAAELAYIMKMKGK